MLSFSSSFIDLVTLRTAAVMVAAPADNDKTLAKNRSGENPADGIAVTCSLAQTSCSCLVKRF